MDDGSNVKNGPAAWVRVVVAGVASLLLAVAFSWPVARYAGRGIAYTAFERGETAPREMVPGDHLQFLYHLWLAQDTFAGWTPWFHNLYEFNTGDDAERRAVTTYYLPFSAFFAVGSAAGGRAFGWNFAGWVSLWLAGLFAWALARRYAPGELSAAALALVPLAFPYTWVNLLSGSPTGMALAWVPVLLYGLDRWAADGSAAGAAWAGATLAFAEWSDTHVFFFAVLVAPFWTVFCWCHHRGWRWPTRREWGARVASAWPLLLGVVLAGVQVRSLGKSLGETAVAAGRGEGEVSLFSVPVAGLWRTGGVAKTYVGAPALALGGVLAALGVAGLFRRGGRRRAAVSLLLVLGAMAGIAILSAGMANPFGPRLWKALVRVVPPYGMIRQADKIFCLMPMLFMVACALGLRTLPAPRTARARWVRRAVCAAVLLAVGASWQARHKPGVCLVDAEQGAYAAVAADAAARGTEPRALAIPLWPGDSHLSSPCQHDASLYRIRMINGYRPTVRRDYYENIFLPLESVNLGWPSEEQLRLLGECGAEYLLFHEDAFPEKAGSFPAGVTLANLLRHPRLRFLARDRGVWAFRILDSPENQDVSVTLPVLFPVRTWNWKNGVEPGAPGTRIVEGAAASACAWLHADAAMQVPATSRWIRVAGPWKWEWRFRAKGRGELEWSTRDDGGACDTRIVAVNADDWTWYTVPAEIAADELEAARELTADFRVVSGEADMDAVLLTCAGDFPPKNPGDVCEVPAMAFFGSGFCNPADGGVSFRPGTDPAGEILWARNLPLEPGSFRVTLDAAADVPGADGVLLGTLVLRTGVGEVSCEVVEGQPAEVRVEVPDNRFFKLAFRYAREVPVRVRSVRFERL